MKRGAAEISMPKYSIGFIRLIYPFSTRNKLTCEWEIC